MNILLAVHAFMVVCQTIICPRKVVKPAKKSNAMNLIWLHNDSS